MPTGTGGMLLSVEAALLPEPLPLLALSTTGVARTLELAAIIPVALSVEMFALSLEPSPLLA